MERVLRALIRRSAVFSQGLGSGTSADSHLLAVVGRSIDLDLVADQLPYFGAKASDLELVLIASDISFRHIGAFDTSTTVENVGSVHVKIQCTLSLDRSTIACLTACAIVDVLYLYADCL